MESFTEILALPSSFCHRPLFVLSLSTTLFSTPTPQDTGSYNSYLTSLFTLSPLSQSFTQTYFSLPQDLYFTFLLFQPFLPSRLPCKTFLATASLLDLYIKALFILKFESGVCSFLYGLFFPFRVERVRGSSSLILGESNLFSSY